MSNLESNSIIGDMAREVIGCDLVLDQFSGIYRGPIKRVGVTVKDWAPTKREQPKPTLALYFDVDWYAVDTQYGWRIQEEDVQSGVRLITLPIETIAFMGKKPDGGYQLVFPHIGNINIFPPGSENNLIRENLKFL